LSEIKNDYGLNNIGMGTGITITTGFDLGAQKPLDSRIVVKNMTDLKAMPKDKIYLGLLVHVIDDNKLYQWKYNLDENGVLSEEPDWGPIEAEVSTKDISDLSEIDFANTPSLQLQKNKNNFFPIVHEKYIYDDSAVALPDKYQTKVDNSLATTNKTVVGSVNELNTKMEDTIKDFREQIQKTIDELNASVAAMRTQTEKDMAAMKASLQKEIDDMLAELNRKSQEMDKAFEDLLADINQQIADLQNKIQGDIDQMLQDTDNVIMTDKEIADLMAKINKNISDLAAL
jgi:polyhydroxyalkanoate synthesis regulator phasin